MARTPTRVTSTAQKPAKPQEPEGPRLPNASQTQLMMAGFVPSTVVGANLVDVGTRAVYKFFHGLGYDIVGIVVLPAFLLSCFFAAIVFLLDSVPTRLRYLFYVFNVLSIFYFAMISSSYHNSTDGPSLRCPPNCKATVSYGETSIPTAKDK